MYFGKLVLSTKLNMYAPQPSHFVQGIYLTEMNAYIRVSVYIKISIISLLNSFSWKQPNVPP